jgi:hypothetical protein
LLIVLKISARLSVNAGPVSGFFCAAAEKQKLRTPRMTKVAGFIMSEFSAQKPRAPVKFSTETDWALRASPV